MSDKYLITGATGFIGTCLTRFLVENDQDVSLLVRDRALNWRLRDISGKLHIYESDILNPDLEQLIEKIKPNIVFHLSAYGSLASDKVDINSILDINIKGLINLINALKRQNLKIFVNTGSSSEYGIKNIPMKETDVLNPINDYGVSKAAATLYGQKAAIIDSLPIVTYRLFSPYGFFEDKNRLIPSVIYNALKNKPINLTSPSNVRDFVFIDDVANAYVAAVNGIIKPGDIFNIGSGQQHSVKEIVDIVMEITGSKSEIKWNALELQKRQIEPKTWRADVEHAKKDLKWEAKTSLYDGLQKTVSWLKNNMSYYE